MCSHLVLFHFNKWLVFPIDFNVFSVVCFGLIITLMFVMFDYGIVKLKKLINFINLISKPQDTVQDLCSYLYHESVF